LCYCLLTSRRSHKHREQKLELERRKAAQKELDGCSFAPKLRAGAVHPSSAMSSGPRREKPGGGGRKSTDEGPFYVSGSAHEDVNHAGQFESAELHRYDVNQQVQDYYGVEHATRSEPALPGRVPLPVKAKQLLPTQVAPHSHQGYQASLAEPDDDYYDEDPHRYEDEGPEELEDAEERYSGLPVQDTPYAAPHGTRHGGGAGEMHRTLFASPPYRTGSSAGYEQHHQRQGQAPNAAVGHSGGYSFGALAEPDEADYGDVSLYDLGGLAAAGGESEHERTSPQPLITGFRGFAHATAQASEESPPPPPPSAMPTATYHGGIHRDFHAHPSNHVTYQDDATGPRERNVRYAWEGDSAPAASGVEFSPSPVKGASRSAMYDML
jgi:hypothetical protein